MYTYLKNRKQLSKIAYLKIKYIQTGQIWVLQMMKTLEIMRIIRIKREKDALGFWKNLEKDMVYQNNVNADVNKKRI